MIHGSGQRQADRLHNGPKMEQSKRMHLVIFKGNGIPGDFQRPNTFIVSDSHRLIISSMESLPKFELLRSFLCHRQFTRTIGEAVLDTLKALMMFLDRDTLEQLPLLLASNIGVLPSELDKQ
ncbi:hypothetical protein OSTOST_07212, partial [Ostertagia ostertagi]